MRGFGWLLGMALALLVGPAWAGPDSYTFTEQGWNVPPGPVSGPPSYTSPPVPVPGVLTFSFTAMDKDGVIKDGLLAPTGEVTAFAISWSGNAVIPAETGGIGGLLELNFPVADGFADPYAVLHYSFPDLNQVVIGDITLGSGQGTCPAASYSPSCAFFSTDGRADALASLDAPAQVPEPRTFGWIGLCGAALLACRHRRAAASAPASSASA